MIESEQDYWRRRADEELRHAASSATEHAAAKHRELADLFERRAAGGDPSESPLPAPPDLLSLRRPSG